MFGRHELGYGDIRKKICSIISHRDFWSLSVFFISWWLLKSILLFIKRQIKVLNLKHFKIIFDSCGDEIFLSDSKKFAWMRGRVFALI